jgi:hypothetical protein
MLEKIGRAAEQVATSASRRRFFGRVGQAAFATAGLLAVPARAAGTARCSKYQCKCVGRRGVTFYHECHADGSACVPLYYFGRCTCGLSRESLLADCSRCG